VIEDFKNIPETEFSRAIENLENRVRSCIIYNGDYFEYKICFKRFLNLCITFVALVSKHMGRIVYLSYMNIQKLLVSITNQSISVYQSGWNIRRLQKLINYWDVFCFVISVAYIDLSKIVWYFERDIRSLAANN